MCFFTASTDPFLTLGHVVEVKMQIWCLTCVLRSPVQTHCTQNDGVERTHAREWARPVMCVLCSVTDSSSAREENARDLLCVVAASEIVCDPCTITSAGGGRREEAGWLNPSSTDKVSVQLRGTGKLLARITLRTLSTIYPWHRDATMENAYEFFFYCFELLALKPYLQ